MKKVLFVMKGCIERTPMKNEGGESIDLNKIKRRPDGAATFNVRPMRSGDYDYLAFELPSSVIRGLRDQGREVNFNTVLSGRIELKEVRKTLGQFEALPVTDEHVFISTSNKDEIAGHVLKNGKLESDGHVITRLVIENSDLLVQIESGEKVEVSIGFMADAPEINPASGEDGEADFFIRNIELNHLAVVRRGRAGRKARLLNSQPLMVHGFNADFFTGDKTMKIKINNAEFDLPEEAVSAINVERSESQTQLSNTQKQLSDANSIVVKLQGENAALQTQVDESDSVESAATQMLAAHNELSSMLEGLGSDVQLTFGNYDATEVLRDALTKAGVKGMENQDYTALCGAYAGFKGANASKKDEGSLEAAHSTPANISITPRSDRGAARVTKMVHSKWFGKTPKKEAK